MPDRKLRFISGMEDTALEDWFMAEFVLLSAGNDGGGTEDIVMDLSSMSC
jgi:hypothetical protein